MEFIYFICIDINVQWQQIMFVYNSSEMQILEGFFVFWDEFLCKCVFEDQCMFSNDVVNCWYFCIVVQELGIVIFLSIFVCLVDGFLFGIFCVISW